MIEVDGVIPLPNSSFKRAVDVLTRAFWDDVLSIFFFPDESLRQKYLPLFMGYKLKQGRLHGNVLTTSENIEGIAIWTHSSSISNSLLSALRGGGFYLILRLGSTRIKLMLNFSKFTQEQKKKFATPPYMHLTTLGVDPEKQGQGYCSKTLRPVFSYLDEVGLPCYLETQTEKNVSIYEHYGFEVVSECIPPGVSFTHWDMIRPPQ